MSIQLWNELAELKRKAAALEECAAQATATVKALELRLATVETICAVSKAAEIEPGKGGILRLKRG